MRKLKKDIVGQRFGRLTVIAPHDCGERKIRYICQCDCGNVKITRADNLTSGGTKSCGCLKKEQDKINLGNVKHQLCGTRIYRIWAGMKSRCYNKNDVRYDRYGGRGIIVCDEWKNDFKSFYDWAIINEYSAKLTIDRIDNDGNYEPNNCRWVTNAEQCNNRSTNINVTIGNATKTLTEWCNIFEVDYTMIHARYIREQFVTIDELFNGLHYRENK